MSRLPKLRLLDIQDAIDRVFEYVEGADYSSFLNDQKTQDAVARNTRSLARRQELCLKSLGSKLAVFHGKISLGCVIL